MIGKIKSLGKQTIFYGFGSILNKLLGFILIPIYQTHIPISDFGNLVYFEVIIMFLSAILNFGIASGHQRFFYLEKENKTYGRFLFNNFTGSLILSLVSVLPLLFFSGNLAEALTGSENQNINLQITLGIVIVEILYVLPLQVLQYESKPLPYLAYNALKLLITFSITIFFVINLNMGFTGFLAARLIGGFIVLLVAIFHIVAPRCTLEFSLESLSKSLKFGFPHVVSSIGYTIFMLTDRFMLNWLSTSEELGKYGFGFRIANFVNLIFVQTIGMSYFPSIMNNEKESDNLRYYRKMLTYYCFLLAFLIMGFLFFYKDILWIVGKDKDYWEGLKVVPILSLSFMIMGMNYFVQAGLFLKNKTKYYLIPSLIAVPINIAINTMLIPKYGMIGAAIAVVITQITYTSILSFISGFFMKVGYEWYKIFLIYFIAIVLYGLGNYVHLPNPLQFIFKILLLIVFPLSLYFLNFFEQVEVQKLKSFIKKLPFSLGE